MHKGFRLISLHLPRIVRIAIEVATLQDIPINLAEAAQIVEKFLTVTDFGAEGIGIHRGTRRSTGFATSSRDTGAD
jgi:hypothetical protein